MGEDVGAGQGFTNIDALPLGNLLQPSYEGGVRRQVASPRSGRGLLTKLRKKGFKNFSTDKGVSGNR